MLPKISIITVCFNAKETISSTIESVLAQNYSNFEYIIIDGNSTDGTQDAIKPYLDSISFYCSEPDKGLYDALNKGIEKSTGDIIGIIHADDIYAHEGVLSRIAAGFRKFKPDSIYSDLVYVSATNTKRIIRYWRSGTYRKARFLHGWMPPHPTLFVKKEVYTKCGGFDTNFKSAADYEFILRAFFVKGFSSKYVPGVTVKMRVGGISNKNLKNRLKANSEDRMAWKKHGLTPPAHTILVKPLRKLPQYIPTLGLVKA